MDGTILNTIDDITDSVNVIMERHGLPTYDVPAIKSFVGNGLRKLMEKAMPEGEAHPQFEEIYAEFLDYYNAHSKIKTAPYEGIRDVMAALKARGVKMAIVTNKIQPAAEDLMMEHFYPDVEYIVGDVPGRNKKPHPDAINAALEILGVSPEEKDSVLYIGDSEVDAATALNSGLDYVLCLWGFRTREELSEFKPVLFAESPAELLEI